MRRLALIIGSVLLALRGGAAENVSWEITPAVAGPGQPFRLQVRVESDETLGPADRVGRELKPPRGMALRFSGQAFRSGSAEAILNFSGVAPEEEGAHRIPAFALRFSSKSVQVPEITLQVSRSAGYRRTGRVRTELVLPERAYYVGERLRGEVRMLHGGSESVGGFFGLEGQAEGFTFEWGDERPNEELAEGKGYRTSFTLTPLRAGSSEVLLDGTMLVLGGGPDGPGDDARDRPFTFRRRLTVEHVPTAGRPADWNGAIGRFVAESVHVSNNRPEVGEPVRLRAVLTGEGNLDRILPPEVVGGDAWEIVPTTERRRKAEDQRVFAYTIVPRLPGRQTTPAIRLAVFDPEERRFTTLVFPSQEMTVTGQAPAKVDLVTNDPAAPMDSARSVTPTQPAGLATPAPSQRGLLESPVHSVTPLAASAAFMTANGWLLLAATGLLGFALVTDHLAKHPDILLRWRARRAVRTGRRAASRARRKGDGQAFAQAVVAALRYGCGTILRAEPRALTPKDIRRVLAAADPKLLEDLFGAADGAKFGGTPPTGGPAADPALALLDLLEKELT